MTREAFTSLDKIDLSSIENEVAESVVADFRHLQIVYFSACQSANSGDEHGHPKMLFTEAINYLYARLAVIDTKSGALLQSNALIAAIAAIGATMFPSLKCDTSANCLILFFILASLVFAGAGTFYSLRAARLKFERCGQPDHYVKRTFSPRIRESKEWISIADNCGSDEERERVRHILDYIVTILSVTTIRVRLIHCAGIYAAFAVGSLFAALACVINPFAR